MNSPHHHRARRQLGLSVGLLTSLTLVGCYESAPDATPTGGTRDLPRDVAPSDTSVVTATTSPATASTSQPSTPTSTGGAGSTQGAPSLDIPGTNTTFDVVGMQATRPVTWIPQRPSNRMRVFQFVAPGRENNDAAEVTAFYFGSGQGGSRDANIARWKGQFTDDVGRPIEPVLTDKVTPTGIEYTIVELEGSYSRMGAPKPIPNQQMVAVVVNAPRGNVFFRLVGPTATVDDHRDAFLVMVEGLDPMTDTAVDG
ncbi:MAG: hypothetical protein AAF432_05325 [Planctomycetota bacterium]